MSELSEDTSDFLFYSGHDGSVRVEVIVRDDTVWTSQKGLAEIFNTSRENVTIHISNVLKEGELDDISVCKEILHTASDGFPKFVGPTKPPKK